MHDFQPGIAPSGLFWTTRIPDRALRVHGKTARLRLEDFPILDSFVFLGSKSIPARVSLDVTLRAIDKPMKLEPLSSDPTDPSNFSGKFRVAEAEGRFEGSEAGFSFHGRADSDGLWAEMGKERNGDFLHGHGDERIAEEDQEDGGSADLVGVDFAPRARPNPALTRTAITFRLTREGRAAVQIFDLSGRHIATLLEGMLPAGSHSVSWDLRDHDGRRVPAGIYLVRTEGAPESRMTRITVLP